MAQKGLVLVLASVIAVGGVFFPSGSPPQGTLPHVLAATAGTRLHASAVYRALPLFFEANRGQTDPRVKFLSRGAHDVVFFTPTEAVFVLTRNASPGRPDGGTLTVVRMGFAGANPVPRVTGLEELPGRVNYFIGRDPAGWRTNIPTYARVQYENLYPGVDLRFYGNPRTLEYDFVVHPGADPRKIALDFQGTQKLDVDGRSDLVLQMRDGTIRQEKPVLYQMIDGVRQEIPGGYMLETSHRIGFRVGAYDPRAPLIIDPAVSTLAYSTYLGGSGADQGTSIAVDSSGNAYVTGYTTSVDFPVTAGADQTAFGTKSSAGSNDVFVTKLNSTGSGLVYSTYIGGNGSDQGTGIAVDSLGNAYVTGYATSTNFPTTPGVLQQYAQVKSSASNNTVFVTKLNSTGSALLYSTYDGAMGDDRAFGIGLDNAGNSYITGATTSYSVNGLYHGFVIALNSTGSSELYVTFLSGNGQDAGSGIAVDSSHDAYVTGSTTSSNFPTTPGAFQTTLGGTSNAFVTKLSLTGSEIYSTYLGGNGSDQGNGIAVDGSGNAYVTGGTTSTNFPTTSGQTTLGGTKNAFATKLNASGSALVYSTYLGGSGSDQGNGIAVDGSGNAYVTGSTTSTNFPTVGAFQATYGGGTSNAFVAALDPAGTALLYSTYLGGSGSDQGNGIAVDGSGNTYVTGSTTSTNFPTTSGAFRTQYAGDGDAFVAKITVTSSTTSPCVSFGLPPVCLPVP